MVGYTGRLSVILQTFKDVAAIQDSGVGPFPFVSMEKRTRAEGLHYQTLEKPTSMVFHGKNLKTNQETRIIHNV